MPLWLEHYVPFTVPGATKRNLPSDSYFTAIREELSYYRRNKVPVRPAEDQELLRELTDMKCLPFRLVLHLKLHEPKNPKLAKMGT